ncbi:hypothetical protein O1R50_11620 [Glycomyces luteolus]|uniref:Uncharacterized protein n=1 Tax=Glycomyces luteolus TaxID=2670330 RepID=A0A9X3P7N7_9ACTN|nr:hypothetical protein [Glycomyces luteolus]MDA1360276.1 hypothetical protein [Glycomyces luteolus]
MSTDDLIGLVFGLLAIALLVSWPVLPGTRRFAGFKTFPPFRAWAARPHPDAAVAVRAGRRIDLSPGDTDAANATVVVRTAWGNQHSREWSPSLRVSRPLAPLVSVDGVPASWGWGTTKLTLPPGEHLIAVTSSHSRCYKTVHLERGQRIDLDYSSILGATAHRHFEAGNQAHDLTRFRERRGGIGSTGWYFLLVLGGMAVMGAATAAAIANPSGFSAAIGNTAVIGAIAVGLGVGVAVIVGSLAKQARQRRVTVADPPAERDLQGPRILDADAPERIAPAPGWAGLGLHLRFMIDEYSPDAIAALAGGGNPSVMQRWRAIRIGEPESPVCRPWIPAPEVFIDGEQVRASWTRMWLQLQPGEHELVVRVVAPQQQIGSQTVVEASKAEYRRTIHLTPGETYQETLTAEITAVPQSDRPELSEFRARLH